MRQSTSTFNIHNITTPHHITHNNITDWHHQHYFYQSTYIHPHEDDESIFSSNIELIVDLSNDIPPTLPSSKSTIIHKNRHTTHTDTDTNALHPTPDFCWRPLTSVISYNTQQMQHISQSPIPHLIPSPFNPSTSPFSYPFSILIWRPFFGFHFTFLSFFWLCTLLWYQVLNPSFRVWLALPYSLLVPLHS